MSGYICDPGALARLGWCVFPCLPGDKRPAVDRWEQRACGDPATVARFWPSPLHNIGIACGPSGLVVIDLDTHGELPEGWQMPGILDGRDVLAQLCEWARQPWPGTYMVATPSGGWHLYFAAPDQHKNRNSAGKLGPLTASPTSCLTTVRRYRCPPGCAACSSNGRDQLQSRAALLTSIHRVEVNPAMPGCGA